MLGHMLLFARFAGNLVPLEVPYESHSGDHFRTLQAIQDVLPCRHSSTIPHKLKNMLTEIVALEGQKAAET